MRFHSSFVLKLVSHCWWTLTCALPLVLSFSYWSVTVGGLWLVCSHSSSLFDTGQPLLVDFDLCAPTRLVFFTLVSQLEENKTLSYTTWRKQDTVIYNLKKSTTVG